MLDDVNNGADVGPGNGVLEEEESGMIRGALVVEGEIVVVDKGRLGELVDGMGGLNVEVGEEEFVPGWG